MIGIIFFEAFFIFMATMLAKDEKGFKSKLIVFALTFVGAHAIVFLAAMPLTLIH